jgi:proline iminopeptidase
MLRCALLIILISIYISAGAQEGLRSLNGTKLHVNVRGNGEPLVVIHGGPGLNHAYFLPHLQALEKNFKVIYYDQRASGKSAIPSPDSITIKFLADDLEALRKQFKIRKMNVLAHSWGALLAVHYAVLYPGKINKMILSNPSMLSREYDKEVSLISKERSTPEDSVRRAELMRSGPMDIKKYEDFFLLSFKVSTYDPKNLLKLKLSLPENFAQANKALFTGLMKDPAQQANLYDELPRLKFPVLIIHGQADIIPMASIDRLQKNLKKSRLITFEKSGHFPFIEESEKFSATVTGFLKEGKQK